MPSARDFFALSTYPQGVWPPVVFADLKWDGEYFSRE
jgi:hypothetical protein